MLKTLKYTKVLMPIYWFYNKAIATQEEITKYEKYADVILRLDESNVIPLI